MNTPTQAEVTSYLTGSRNLFHSKEGYLAWRAEWKIKYKRLSQQIRKVKLDIKRLMRERASCHASQLWLSMRKAEATALLEIRKLSKQEAQRQYLASKAQT